jgi:YVTN family beta-propeller protein
LEGGDANDESVDNEGHVTAQLLGDYVYRAVKRSPAESYQDPIVTITEGFGNIVLASYPDKRQKPKDTVFAPEAEVPKGILGSKTKISIAVSLTVVALILAISYLLPSHHNTLLPSHIIGAEPYDISVNPSTNTVYVVNSGSNTVSVIDGKTNTVMGNITTDKDPIAVSVNPSTNMAYVANRDGDTVSVIDGKTNTVMGNIKVGGSPWAVSVNPSTNVAYVANYDGDTVSDIDGKTNTVTATIKVGKGPSAVSVNPLTNIAYVANFDGYTLSVIDGKTNAVMGKYQSR